MYQATQQVNNMEFVFKFPEETIIHTALAFFLERARREKYKLDYDRDSNKTTFIVATNYKKHKSIIETKLREEGVDFTIRRNQSPPNLILANPKPSIFVEYAEVTPQPSYTTEWSFHLKSVKSCRDGEFRDLNQRLYQLNKDKYGTVKKLVNSYEPKDDDSIANALLSVSNEESFEDASYLIESFIKFFDVIIPNQ